MSPTTELLTQDGRWRALLTPDGRTATQPIPCFQCGVCCIKWQPLLSPEEIRRLAADLGLTVRTLRRRHIRPYPLRRGWGMLTTGATGGCTFLAFEQGRSFCTIYQHRPDVCREWGAGLDKRECLSGLARMGDAGLLTLEQLYQRADERQDLADEISRRSAAAPTAQTGSGVGAGSGGDVPAQAPAAATTAS